MVSMTRLLILPAILGLLWPGGADARDADNRLGLFVEEKGSVRVSGSLSVTGDLRNDALEARLSAIEESVRQLVPLGTVVAWSGTLTEPKNIEMLRSRGWITADGRALDKKKYADLFAVIGTAHGEPNENQFNIPDLRGVFIRGVDRGAGKDPDATTRAASKPGGLDGDDVGSFQADQFASHTHTTNVVVDRQGGFARGSDTLHRIDTPTEATGGKETRPKNIALHHLVKVTYGRYTP